MKFYTFYRESDNFDDILRDKELKKYIGHKIKWVCHLYIGFVDDKNFEKMVTYINLKYGDDIVANQFKDYTPIPNVDYIPVRK